MQIDATTRPDLLADVPGFESRLVQTDRLRHHVVVGGSGPALLLINGWPQTWYSWRKVMPELAERFTVVAAEPRGMGRSEKPEDGYDLQTLAEDLALLMAHLGHERYAVLGHDVGMWVAYAIAADHPDAVERLAVIEAVIPGISPDPDFFAPDAAVERLFHFWFNRLDGLNEELIRGREAVYFGHQFATKVAPGTHLEQHAIDHYIESIAADPAALRTSFGPYRAIGESMRQNQLRAERALDVPVLAIGGAASLGAAVGTTMRQVARDVTVSVIDDCGHYPAEETPAALLEAIVPFLGAGTT